MTALSRSIRTLTLLGLLGVNIIMGWRNAYSIDINSETNPNIRSAIQGPTKSTSSNTTDTNASTTNQTAKDTPEVVVTELVPGMGVVSNDAFSTSTVGCKCIAEGSEGDTTGNCGTPATRKYLCKGGSLIVIAAILKFTVYTGIILGVFALVALGIAWSLYGAFGDGSGGAVGKKIKGWLIQAVIALAVLFFFSTILRIIAPWVYI